MSIRVMTKVWDTSEQKGSTLLLLLALADHAADDGFCWPGYEHLAQKIRMSTRSVSRLIETLEEDGDLFVIRKKGEHNWYIVRVGLSNQDVIEVLKQRHFDTPDNLSSLQEQDTHDNLAGGDDTATPEPMTQQCPTNLHDPSLLNRQEGGATAPPAPVEDSWPAEPAEQEPKPPPNPAQERLTRMRAKFGGTPGDMVLHCMEAKEAEGIWTVPSYRDLSPQCAAYRRVYEFSPKKYQRKTIDESVAADENSVRFWEEVCQAWADLGWNPTNVKGMLDFYVLGTVPTTKPKGGKNGSASTPRQGDERISDAIQTMFDENGRRRKEYRHG